MYETAEIPAELIALQRDRDHAADAVRAFARENPGRLDAELTRQWSAAVKAERNAIHALHAHPMMVLGPNRFKIMRALRAAARIT
ncbi:hypothetical protein [Streptomyces sp. SID3343]|uniref:hypothetical protein n=1 Tax=Streptomyces sp. SID3343 TaxID=2690260 RepID=UPI00136F7489|nr:hypothetical protein [Streptomyces sp. SID3343]MYV97973.1 hypothetical protein [Streptomyces sp. SID3343]